MATKLHEILAVESSLEKTSRKLSEESAKTFKEHPELRHLLAQDWRLKPKAPPKLFINKE